MYCRELKMSFRDVGIMLFFLFLPIAYPVIYSLIYNPEIVRDVKVVVVDEDRTAESRDIVRKLDATQEVKVIGYAANLEEARRAVDSHECYGIFQIPQGYARKLGTSEQAPVVLYSEMSLLLRYKAMLIASTNIQLEIGSEIQTEKIASGGGEAVIDTSSFDPMPIHNVAMGNSESGFDSFIMPGVLILILHQCIVLAVGMFGGATSENPRMLHYNPVNIVPSTALTMLGQSLCYITILLIPIVWLVHYVPMIFQFPMAGDTLQEMAFLIPLVLSAIGLGYCLQAFITEREAIFVIWVVTSVVFLFLSGLTWPRYAMSPLWKFVSDICPSTWGVEGFIRMNTNGASLTQVSHAYHMLWLLAGVNLFVAYFVQRFIVRPRAKRMQRRYAAINQEQG